jgi:glycyl-tRNA synthetase beta chain
MADLLLELFSEEIPARMQSRAADDLKRLVTDGLVERGITYEAAAAFSTPRRLVLSLTGLPAMSPTLKEERKGPRTDAPAQALEGFLRSTGLSKDQLEARADKKGEVWFAVIEKPGRAAAEVVAEVVEATVRNFPWPKSMRWGAGSLRWVRPLHSILCILHDEAGAQVVPGDVDGIAFGDLTAGHRFMAPGHFAVTSFEDYAAKLKRAFVVLDAADRAAHIEADAQNMAFAQGLEIVEDKGLLAEIAGLVEWPVVLMGPIGEDFLGLPPEVLQTSMKEHQKFLSVRNPKTGRIEKFVTVANRTTADDGSTILAGNLKVLSARLSDARFFWENDLRTVKREGLGAMAAPLAGVTFHNLLGSQAERIARIAALARDLAPAVGADAALAGQAAEVAKADLASEMVYEFPELQGVMGKYYARAAGLDEAVAAACAEHYSPLGPSDAVPTAPVSVAVALADKLDLLTGFWAIDEKPTGSKDPFALRRAALGVIRLILQNGIRLHLDRFIDAGLLRHQITPVNGAQEEALLHTLLSEVARHGVFGAAVHAAIERIDGDAPEWVRKLVEHTPDTSDDLLSFIHDRLKVHLRDQGVRHDVIDACLAMPNKDDLALLVRRAEALSDFLKSDDGENLVQGFKRANNILTQAEAKDGVHYELDPDVKFAEDASEKALFAALDAAEAAIAPAMEAEDFAAAMTAMAGLRAPIDAFFEAVQINTDNQIVRRNRLCLLNRIRAVMAAVARFESLEG